jgi:hypothetical protein
MKITSLNVEILTKNCNIYVIMFERKLYIALLNIINVKENLE